jgi:ATP-binding cassette, subfamily D (ALD), member 3
LSPHRNTFLTSPPLPSKSDQRVTQDIERFTSELSSLYATTFKPVVDIVLFTRKLTRSVGIQGPVMMYLYYILSGFFLRRLLPNFARMTARTQQLEGNFRFHHSRLLMHAEEVAFYRGWEREKVLINDAFNKLYSHSSVLFWKQALVGVFDAWLVKYGATMVGYAVVALPVFGGVAAPEAPGMSAADITRGYIRNTQVLINLAQATGQIVLLYKKITQLAGYTTRVGELLELFVSVSASQEEMTKKFWQTSADDALVEFDQVEIDTPDGDIPLVRDLTMKILPTMHTLIMGPNGSGKSSIFRTLNRMWPVKSGKITRPTYGKRSAVMFVPQRPYFPLGSLREQVIYPDEVSDMQRKGITDDDLRNILADAELAYLIEREGGFDAVKDWVDVLSGGEKQRMGMARIYYHKPTFAALDECTSAVSVDVEGRLYRKCKELGVTMITISHRKQLKDYHNFVLNFPGEGNLVPTFSPLETN